jgi:HIV Tat-specific factor 1
VTGLPFEVTEEELIPMFEKFGILLEDLITNKPKIKLYKNEKGELKGDALVTYFKPESVQLCISLLDETEYKGSILRVQEAVFDDEKNKAEHDTTNTNNNNLIKEKKKPLGKLEKRKLEKARQKLEKRLDWYEDTEEPAVDKNARTVILKRMFTLEELEKDPTLILDLKQDVWEECDKLGPVTNVVLFDVN